MVFRFRSEMILWARNPTKCLDQDITVLNWALINQMDPAINSLAMRKTLNFLSWTNPIQVQVIIVWLWLPIPIFFKAILILKKNWSSPTTPPSLSMVNTLTQASLLVKTSQVLEPTTPNTLQNHESQSKNILFLLLFLNSLSFLLQIQNLLQNNRIFKSNTRSWYLQSPSSSRKIYKIRWINSWPPLTSIHGARPRSLRLESNRREQRSKNARKIRFVPSHIYG